MKKHWLYYFNYIVPILTKSPMVLELSKDRSIAKEFILYTFGWTWKRIFRKKLYTGKVYVLVKRHEPPEICPVSTDIYPNKIIYDVEDFMPLEYKPVK